MNQPRVLITRSAHQASELAERLRSLGLEPVLIPTIELAEPSSFAALDAAMAQLASPASGFHWLVFTSANAVEVFHRRWTAGERDRLPPRLSVAAIGPATARALRSAGWRSDLTPPSAVAESLATALLPHARQPDGNPNRFLLVRAEAARDYLPETLRAAGAGVAIAAAYRNVIPSSSIAQLQSLFAIREYWPDAVTFTSSSTASNLQALLETCALTLPPQVLRVSIGPVTSQTLRELNLPPHAEAGEPTVAALAEAAVLALKRRDEGET